MNNELIAILNYMEKERGIDREVLIEAVEFALQSAARKSTASDEDLRVAIDRESCDIKAYAMRLVVDTPKAGTGEITLKDAKKTQSDAQVGEEIEVEVTPANLGRIAAKPPSRRSRNVFAKPSAKLSSMSTRTVWVTL